LPRPAPSLFPPPSILPTYIKINNLSFQTYSMQPRGFSLNLSIQNFLTSPKVARPPLHNQQPRLQRPSTASIWRCIRKKFNLCLRLPPWGSRDCFGFQSTFRKFCMDLSSSKFLSHFSSHHIRLLSNFKTFVNGQRRSTSPND
jgi:hypothetical protein